jgi:hypothetical protein
MKRRICCIALAMAVAAMLVVPVAALAGSDGTVSGVVSGPTGPVPGTTIAVEYVTKGGVPKLVATLTTGPDGSWTFAGKKGDYRFTFSAEGFYTHTEVLTVASGLVYTLNVTLVAVPPPTATISGRITSSSGAGLHGFVYFYKQNADGTWPDVYLSVLETAWDGTYTKDGLTLGTYKVRLFTVHTGVQWYRYAATIDLATPITLDSAGQVVTGIDAVYPPPAP